MDTLPRARVLVLGDSGAGKTSLVKTLCRQVSQLEAGAESPSLPLPLVGWTLGCDLDVMLYESKKSGQCNFIEFVDVGGSSNSAEARSVFYQGVDAVMLVHDLANDRSFSNLSGWMDELKRFGGGADPKHSGRTMPTLLVGMKGDKMDSRKDRRKRRSMRGTFDTVEVSAKKAGQVLKFERFFDHILHHGLHEIA
jgi:Rab-like protein 3|eukprot:g6790.t1